MATAPPAPATLDLTINGPIATVALNRPHKANAMNAPMWSELRQVFNWLDGAAQVRAVLLTGNGRHFCSGIDLEMLSALRGDGEPARGAERMRQKILELQGDLSAIEACRKPVIAAIQGACVGGGLDIVSCCDLRYASSDARFCIKEIDVGLVADVGSLQRLPFLIGDGVLREMAYTGREMSASEALSCGLVSAVCDSHEDVLAHALQIAETIAAKSPLAVRGIKQTLAYGRAHSIADSLDHVASWNSAMLSFEDVEKAITAARSGQPPQFDD